MIDKSSCTTVVNLPVSGHAPVEDPVISLRPHLLTDVKDEGDVAKETVDWDKVEVVATKDAPV